MGWLEFYNREDEKDNYKNGLLLATIFNAHRTDKKDKFFKPEDFYTFNHLEKTEKKMDWKTQKARLMAFASSTTYQNKREG